MVCSDTHRTRRASLPRVPHCHHARSGRPFFSSPRALSPPQALRGRSRRAARYRISRPRMAPLREAVMLLPHCRRQPLRARNVRAGPRGPRAFPHDLQPTKSSHRSNRSACLECVCRKSTRHQNCVPALRSSSAKSSGKTTTHLKQHDISFDCLVGFFNRENRMSSRTPAPDCMPRSMTLSL